MKTNTSNQGLEHASHMADDLAQSATKAVEQVSASAQNTIDKGQKLAKAGLEILHDSATLAANKARDYSREGVGYAKHHPSQTLLALVGVGVAIYLIYALTSPNSHRV